MDAERWAISVVGQGVRGGVATGKMPSFERDQATCHVRITATARLSQRAAKDPERLHGNAAPMFYCGWSVMPLTVASECSQSQLVPREIGRKQGFLGCSFSLGEVPAAPASRCGLAPVIGHLTAVSGIPSDYDGRSATTAEIMPPKMPAALRPPLRNFTILAKCCTSRCRARRRLPFRRLGLGPASTAHGSESANKVKRNLYPPSATLGSRDGGTGSLCTKEH